MRGQPCCQSEQSSHEVWKGRSKQGATWKESDGGSGHVEGGVGQQLHGL